MWTSLGELGHNTRMLQMTLIIKGKVQRVGFRYSVVDYVVTQNLPIVGHVRNLPDGSVQVIAQGDIEALKDLHRFCTKGPPRAEVREVSQELEQISKSNFSGFNLVAE
jgi:acylphosphatase